MDYPDDPNTIELFEDTEEMAVVELEKEECRAPRCRNGDLCLIPLPGYEPFAEQVQTVIIQDFQDSKKYTTNADITIPKFITHANGEMDLELGDQHITGHDCFIIGSGPGTPVMKEQTYLLLDQIVALDAHRLNLILGYAPGNRSDKNFNHQVFARFPLNMALLKTASQDKLSKIFVVDLHAPQNVQALRNGMIFEISLYRRIIKKAALKAYDFVKSTPGSLSVVLAFSDGNAYKHVEWAVKSVEKHISKKLRREFVFPKVFGTKHRQNSHDCTLTGLMGDIQALPNSLVLSLDDEVASTGTQYKTGKALKEKFKVKYFWPVVTHGVLCANASEVLSRNDGIIDQLFITDSITPNRPELIPLIKSGRIKVFHWHKDLAEIIYRHHWGFDIWPGR